MKPKKFRPVPKNAIKGVYSVVLFFFGLFLLLSPWTKFMFGPAYVFALLTGIVGVYGIPLIVFVFAGNLGAKKQMSRKTGWRLFVGYVVLLIGLEVLFSIIGSKIGGPRNASEFKEAFDAAIAGNHQLILGCDIKLGGGLLGYAIVGALPENLAFLSWVIAIVVILAGLIVIAFPLIKKAVDAALTQKEGKEEVGPEIDQDAASYEQEALYEETKEEPIAIAQQDFRDDPFSFYQTQQETIQPQQESIPSRFDRNYQENAEISGYAKEVETTKPNDGPVLKAGLTEAFFDIDGTGFALPPQEEIKQEPAKPTPAVFDSFGSDDISIGEIEIEEEKPSYAQTPSFIKEEQLVNEEPAIQNEPIREELAQEKMPEAQEEQPEPNTVYEPEAEPSYETEQKEETIYVEPEPLPVQSEDEIEEEEEDEEEPESLLNQRFEQTPAPVPQPAPKPVEEAPRITEPTILAGWHWADERPEYEMPSMELLHVYDNSKKLADNLADCEAKKNLLNSTLESFRAGAQVTSFTIGPSVTRYDIKTDAGVSVSTLTKYMDDISQALSGANIHFEKVVAGKTTAGLEIPNATSTTVGFREILEKMPPLDENNNMFIPFGETISGEFKSADLTSFPHLLVAGTTGSGKSIFIHGLILALLMRNRPEDCKFVLVDPKRVEMTKYKNLPHLLCPIIQEPEETKNCLEKLCEEMELRYKVFAAAECRDIREFNNEYADQHKVGRMPFIVVVVDEYADIVEQCKDVASAVSRLCAKARAAGIHLVIATQRPSVNVINGVIKANIPSRVALKVSTSQDSQVILDRIGAEDLIGYGDMLVMCDRIQVGGTVRMQGCFVTGAEIRAVTEHIRSHAETKFNPLFLDLSGKPASVPAETQSFQQTEGAKAAGNSDKYEFIKGEVMRREFTSISQIQREYGVGFPRAGKIFAQLQREGIVDTTPISASKGCRVLIHADDMVSQDNPGSTDQNSVISSPFGKE